MRTMLMVLVLLAPAGARAAEPAAVPSNLDDVAAGYSSGLPLVRSWCPTWTLPATAKEPAPAGLDYYADLLRRGYRIVPVITLPPYSTPKGGEDFQTARDPYSNKSFKCKDGNRPLIRWLDLRYNNLSGTFMGNAYRFRPVVVQRVGKKNVATLGPLTWDNAPRTALVYTRNPDGTPEDQSVADTLGPVDNWSAEGELLGGSQFVARLVASFPALKGLTFADNNEVANELIDTYREPSRGYGQPRPFLPDEKIRALSIRMADWIKSRRETKPNLSIDDVIFDWHAAKQGLFGAWRDAFVSKLPADLRDVRTIQYQGMQEETWGFARASGWDPRLGYGQGVYVDGAAQQFYLEGTPLTDIDCSTVAGRYGIAGMLGLIPGWESMERRNPRSVREVSVQINEKSIALGQSLGLTKRITPEIYQGYCHFVLWVLSDAGHPLHPRWFTSVKSPPQKPLGDATIEQYFLQWAEAVNVICENPLYREFYQRGERIVVGTGASGHPLATVKTGWEPYPDPSLPDNRWRILECSANPPRESWYLQPGGGKTNLDPRTKLPVAIRVWSCAIKHPDRDQWLIVAFTPCELAEPTITVTVPGHGDETIPTPAPWSYTLVGETPEQQPIRIQKARINGEPATIEILEETVR